MARPGVIYSPWGRHIRVKRELHTART